LASLREDTFSEKTPEASGETFLTGTNKAGLSSAFFGLNYALCLCISLLEASGLSLLSKAEDLFVSAIFLIPIFYFVDQTVKIKHIASNLFKF
jgi:hypothetical protein